MDDMKRRKATGISISEEEKEVIMKYSNRVGLGLSQFIRVAAAEYIENHRRTMGDLRAEVLVDE